MTKKQKAELIAQLKEIAVKNGFTLDRWGNYKKQVGSKGYRIKFKKINCRLEVKGTRVWFKIKSTPVINIDPKKFNLVLQTITKGE